MRIAIASRHSCNNFRFVGIMSLVLKGVESIRKGVEIKKRDLSRQDKIIEDKIKNVPQYDNTSPCCLESKNFMGRRLIFAAISRRRR